MANPRVFLVQTSGAVATHCTVQYEDRTHADEVAKYLYYRHEDWEQKKRDGSFGEVRIGDTVLAYRTTNVTSFPRQIRFVYEVTGVEFIEEDIQAALTAKLIDEDRADKLSRVAHVLKLKVQTKLRQGFELSLIKQWVVDRRLSKKMDQCGLLGFNICEVNSDDLETILEWDKSQPESVPKNLADDLREEDLRDFLARQRNLGCVGAAYRQYALYEDESGRLGEEYDTGTVGRIDLLYRHPAKEEFLVVELKRTHDTPDQAAGQLLRYMGWVKERLANGSRVKGLLIVRSASEELRLAMLHMRDCALVTFEVSFSFKAAGRVAHG